MWARLENLYIAGSMAIGGSIIKQGKTEESPVAEQFNGEGHTLADVTVVAIDQIYSHDSCLRKIRESRWIRTLETSYPSGMNLRLDSL